MTARDQCLSFGASRKPSYLTCVQCSWRNCIPWRFPNTMRVTSFVPRRFILDSRGHHRGCCWYQDNQDQTRKVSSIFGSIVGSSINWLHLDAGARDETTERIYTRASWRHTSQEANSPSRGGTDVDHCIFLPVSNFWTCQFFVFDLWMCCMFHKLCIDSSESNRVPGLWVMLVYIMG